MCPVSLTPVFYFYFRSQLQTQREELVTAERNLARAQSTKATFQQSVNRISATRHKTGLDEQVQNLNLAQEHIEHFERVITEAKRRIEALEVQQQM